MASVRTLRPRPSQAVWLHRAMAADPDRRGQVIPVLLGAVAGALPVSLLGSDRPVGLVALLAWGVVGASAGSCFWVHGPVIGTVAGAAEQGIGTAAFTAGLGPADLLRACLHAAFRSVLGGVGIAALAAVLAGSVAGVYGAGWSLGAARGPRLALLGGALGLLVISFVFSALVGLRVRAVEPAMLLWRVNLVIVLTVTMSAAWWEPASRLLVVLPLSAAWPLAGTTEGTSLSGVTLTLVQRVLLSLVWGAAGVLVVWRHHKLRGWLVER